MSENREVKIVTLEHINKRLTDIENSQIAMMEASSLLLIFIEKDELDNLDEFISDIVVERLNKLINSFLEKNLTKEELDERKGSRKKN